MKLTYKYLLEKKACYRHLKRFKRMFPKGAKVTPDNLKKYFKGVRDWSTLMSILMDILSARKNETWSGFFTRWSDNHGYPSKFHEDENLDKSIELFFKKIPRKWKSK